MNTFRSAILPIVLCSDAALAAGGSYLVDDAAITSESSCQIESWLRHSDSGVDEIASTPACTGAGVEYSVTFARDAGAGEGTNALTPGLKWVSGDIEQDRWAIGVAATATLIDGRIDNALVYVPISVAVVPASSLVVHANLGEREKRGGHIDALYGLGIDVAAANQWHVLAEGIVVGPHERTWQTGLRWICSNAVAIDVVYGLRETASTERWLTLGFNIAP